MASFPVEINLAKMLVLSEKLRCSEEILTIVALLSVGDIFIRYSVLLLVPTFINVVHNY